MSFKVGDKVRCVAYEQPNPVYGSVGEVTHLFDGSRHLCIGAKFDDIGWDMALDEIQLVESATQSEALFGNLPESVTNAIHEIAEVFAKKSNDYSDGKDPFSNFNDVAEQTSTTPAAVVETYIAMKQTRLKNLQQADKTPANESVRDSILDRAVYSLLALAMASDTSNGVAP